MKKRLVLFLLVFVIFCSVASAKRALNCSVDNCDGLEGLWHLDGDFVDASGEGHGGSCSVCPVSLGLGNTGGAYTFDFATNKRVLTGSSSGLEGSTGITLSAWVFLEADRGYSNGILTRARYDYGDGAQYNFHINGQRLHCSVDGGNPWGSFGVDMYSSSSAGNLVPLNEWAHVACVWNGTDDAIQLYVDGVDVSTSLSDRGPLSSIYTTRSGIDTLIGNAHRAGAGNIYELPFDGSIDEASIWRRSMSASQVLSLYNLGVSPTSSFNGTNFESVENMSSIYNMTLANDLGSIVWNGSVDARGEDYDQYVTVGQGFVSVNASALDVSINSSAVVTVSVDSCDSWQIYYAAQPVSSLAELKSVGSVVGTSITGCTSYCSNPTCSNNVLSYTVEHFDGTGGEGSAQPVPEFSTYAMLLALVLTIGGFVAIRNRRV